MYAGNKVDFVAVEDGFKLVPLREENDLAEIHLKAWSDVDITQSALRHSSVLQFERELADHAGDSFPRVLFAIHTQPLFAAIGEQWP